MIEAIENLKNIYLNQQRYNLNTLETQDKELVRLKLRINDLNKDCVYYRKLLTKNNIKF